MQPVISRCRATLPGGLWAQKLTGDFVEGEASLTQFSISGRASIKVLGDRTRVFIEDFRVAQRKIVLQEKDKKRLIDHYKAGMLKLRRDALVREGKDPDEPEDLEDEEVERRKEIERQAIEKIIFDEENKVLPLPKLGLYLMKKKPKTKMSAPHRAGIRVVCPSNPDGLVGRQGTVGSFEASLKDVPDALAYGGLAVLKLPADAPMSSDAVVYAILKFASAKSHKHKTIQALHLAEVHEMLSRAMDGSAAEKEMKALEKVRSPDCRRLALTLPPTRRRTSERSRSARRRRSAGRAGAAEGFSDAAGELARAGPYPTPTRTTSNPTLPLPALLLNLCRQPSNVPKEDKAKKEAEERAAAEEAKASESSRWIKPQHYYTDVANKAWQAFDLGPDDEVGVAMLMKLLEYFNISLVGAQAERLFKATDYSGNGELSMSEFENFLMAYDVMGPAAPDILAMDIHDSLKSVPTEEYGAFGRHPEGMDASAFSEGVKMLGIRADVTNEEISSVFSETAGGKNADVSKIFLTLVEFKKGWLKLADLEREMKKRGMKYESGVLAQGRNRERLFRMISDQELAYLKDLEMVSGLVEKVKMQRRQKKDEAKRRRDAEVDKIHHMFDKFVAARGQESRLLVKNEKEEKQKKRSEEKLLRNRLMQRQAEQDVLAKAAMSANNEKVERLRTDQIKAAGLDKLDLSASHARIIPHNLYDKQEALDRLGYLVLADFSNNLVEALPEDFLGWMMDCRKLSLANNRLQVIPDDIGKLGRLEMLELDSNRIEFLPETMSSLSKLQRLNLSNNLINALPDQIGLCVNLRWLSAHTNNFSRVPLSIGACYRLEYLDLSHNKIKELPDDMEHLVSLTHLDLSTNRIGHLPPDIGSCAKLVYFSMNTNYLAFLPTSFSKLKNLVTIDLENNEVISGPNLFNNLAELKKLNVRKNNWTEIFGDIGGCVNLQSMDVSVNSIKQIPPEIGLLVSLQELHMHRNELVDIPSELGVCRMLQRLEIPYNHIRGCLPETIGLITNLRYLDCSFNEIESLPRSIIGLKEIRTMNFERCLLSGLPDTVVHLQTLELLNLANNKFTNFPIELSRLQSLHTLNLRNNSIALLPRSIHGITNVTTLDLSKNQLRALPVEFVDAFETIPNMHLGDNPWTDLPPRWGRLWPGKTSTEGPTGYSIPEALDFLYGMRAFYDVADRVWEELGVYHYTNRLNLNDFVEELRKRMPKSWHEGLIEHVKYIYFTARRDGVYPRWYAMEPDDPHCVAVEKEARVRKEYDKQRREINVQRTRAAHQQMLERIDRAYDIDLARRSQRASELQLEHKVNDAYMQNMASIALHHSVKKREEKAERRAESKVKFIERSDRNEIARLQEILEADSDYVDEERKAMGLKPRRKKKKKANVLFEL